MGHGTVSLSVSAARPRLETVDAADAPHEAQGAPQKEGRSERSNDYSGRLLLRMPKALHAALARASETEHISLNQFINDALEKAIDPRALQDSRDAKTRSGRQSGVRKEGSRTVSRLLVVNLIVVAVVGILAVALLVQTLR